MSYPTKRSLTDSVRQHAQALLDFEPAEKLLRSEVARYGRTLGAQYFLRLTRDEPENFTPDAVFWAIRLGEMRLASHLDGRSAHLAKVRPRRKADPDIYDV